MSSESDNEPPVEVDRVPETQFPDETETDRFQLTLASDPYSMLDTEVLLDLFFSPAGIGCSQHRFESPALVRIDEESEMQCQDSFDDFQAARGDLFQIEAEEGPEKIQESASDTEECPELKELKDNEDGIPGYERAGESDGETQEPSSYKNDDCEQDEVNQISLVEAKAEQDQVNQIRQESLVEAEAEQDQIRQESLVEAEAEQDQIRQESLVEAKVVSVEPEASGKNEETLNRPRSEQIPHKQDTTITKACTDQPMPRLLLGRPAPRSRKLTTRRKLVPATEFDEDGWLCPSAHKKKHPKQGFLDGWLNRKGVSTRCDV